MVRNGILSDAREKEPANTNYRHDLQIWTAARRRNEAKGTDASFSYSAIFCSSLPSSCSSPSEHLFDSNWGPFVTYTWKSSNGVLGLNCAWKWIYLRILSSDLWRKPMALCHAEFADSAL